MNSLSSTDAENEIVDLLNVKIATACDVGKWDEQLENQEPIPTCLELMLEHTEWTEDEVIEEILLLSAMVCSDTMSLYRVDTTSDAEYRAALLKELSLSAPPPKPSQVACLFTAFYGEDRTADPEPDPTVSPFYLAV